MLPLTLNSGCEQREAGSQGQRSGTRDKRQTDSPGFLLSQGPRPGFLGMRQSSSKAGMKEVCDPQPGRMSAKEEQSPCQPSLAHMPSRPAPAPSLPLHYLFTPQGLVDGESPVVVHGEQDGFARVVEPGCSCHVHPPLPGGHDRRDCVPCHGRKQAGLCPSSSAVPERPAQGVHSGQAEQM